MLRTLHSIYCPFRTIQELTMSLGKTRVANKLSCGRSIETHGEISITSKEKFTDFLKDLFQQIK